MRKYLTLCLLFSVSVLMAQPKFKSRNEDFAYFLKNNIIYPPYSKQNCIQGVVNISFKLNSEGQVYSSKITKGIISDLDNEALRLIRLSSGKWQIPVGYDTTISVIAPVNFQLTGYGCEYKTGKDIQIAIAAYQTEEDLTDAVANFYKNKNEAKPGQEAKIIAIKAQLGIDDEYLDSLVKNGLKKIKQGDKQGACEDFTFVKNMGSEKADEYLTKYCR